MAQAVSSMSFSFPGLERLLFPLPPGLSRKNQGNEMGYGQVGYASGSEQAQDLSSCERLYCGEWLRRKYVTFRQNWLAELLAFPI